MAVWSKLSVFVLEVQQSRGGQNGADDRARGAAQPPAQRHFTSMAMLNCQSSGDTG